MLYRYGQFVAARARLLLIIAAVLVIGGGILGASAFGKLKSGGFDDPAAPSTQAAQLIDANFGGATNLVFLVRTRPAPSTMPRPRRPDANSPRT